MKSFVGIDPGWKNLGYSKIAVEEDGSAHVLTMGTMDPSKYGINGTAKYLEDLGLFVDAEMLTIERYVPYDGKQNADSERILMVTGACIMLMGSDDKVLLKRAIDWKIELCKYLVKQRGFSNPSSARKLDKEFSLAAAINIFGDKFKSDHEADASCLAYLPSRHFI